MPLVLVIPTPDLGADIIPHGWSVADAALRPCMQLASQRAHAVYERPA
jgi:hypothetical protein